MDTLNDLEGENLWIGENSLSFTWYSPTEKANFTAYCSWRFIDYDEIKEHVTIELELDNCQKWVEFGVTPNVNEDEDDMYWIDDISLSENFLRNLEKLAEQEINYAPSDYEMWEWYYNKCEQEKEYYDEIW